MKPLKLTMQAFGSYGRQTVIDFRKTNQNLFLITGDTGSGKTTIFDAIVFALYGEASSSANKKDGVELQSQFAEPEVEPFVELEFLEGMASDARKYVVRRTPRHVRPLRRGKGSTEEKESVVLILPDGTEYPRKETDKKLEEIIGLTKSQFMQVAMIAQGEFMELLRARSDDKKIIFRKLFHTEIYEAIVKELAQRRKEKQGEISQIKTKCQTEIAHVKVPEGVTDEEDVPQLQALKERISLSEHLSVTDMEAFMEVLERLCHRLKEACDQAQEVYTTARKDALAKRDAYSEAGELEKRFDEMKQAEEELKICEQQAEEMTKNRRLALQIKDAWDIYAVWERYSDAKKSLEDTRNGLIRQQEAFPELKKIYEAATVKEKEEKKLWDEQVAAYAKVSERAQKALDVFKEIRKAEKDVKEKAKWLDTATGKEAAAAQALADLEKKEQEQRKTAEELGDVPVRKEQWNTRSHQAVEIKKDIQALQKAEEEVERQRQTAHQACKSFQTASEIYERENQNYETMRRLFLNAQAGLIAKEQLEEGKPCPVCGSIHHPHPCELKEEHKELSREKLDTLAEQVSRLRTDQEKASSEAKAANALLEEKTQKQEKDLEKLERKMKEWLPAMPEVFSLKTAGEKLTAWDEELRDEKERITRDIKRLKATQDFLQGVEEKKQRLKQEGEEARKATSDAQADFSASQSRLYSLQESKDYPTEGAARDALEKAKKLKDDQEARYQAILQAKTEAEKEKTAAETKISQYQSEIPGKEEEMERRRVVYQQTAAEKKLTGEQWKGLTDIYDRKKADDLQNRIHKYETQKAAARRAFETATAAIDGRLCPMMEELEQAKIKAERQMETAQGTWQALQEEHRTDSDVLNSLKPIMVERRKVMEMYQRLDHLYNVLAGNVSGSRMDMETFVQRYYLERILVAANRRFQEMSAGQFELRMCDMERAGKGKNRGLDLMVYSAVTGKEREVRTLSGGESFMAALSLALGMADQIQESAASVSLDVMFIDEGFGSLDDHSRDKAIKVLQDMASGSKMIGIISHVTELKQEIEDQLIVQKDKNGSHIEWQIS